MTSLAIALSVVLIAPGAAWLTGLVRRFALKRGILDHPGARSSHTLPTPRGGGLAIVLLASAAVMIFWISGQSDWRLSIALLVGGGAVALVGFLDDRGRIGVGARILVHFSAAALAVWLVGGPRQLDFGSYRVSLEGAGLVIGVLGIVWSINLFNFMDGIDGIAASEAIFVAGGGAALTLIGGGSAPAAVTAGILVSASAGFLVWNWPPAKIFMGDVGSGYLGYCLAVVALAASKGSPPIFNAWLVLYAVFIVDATVTLIRRAARLERVYQPHRSHAYQRLSRRWGGHAPVTKGLTVVNLILLAPLAWACVAKPGFASWWMAAAFLPLTLLSIAAGSGRKGE